MQLTWHGVTRPKSLRSWAREAGHQLANAGKQGDWRRVLTILDEHPDMVNAWRPGGRAMFAPLHHVAYGGGSVEVARELIARGAWRTLRTARGTRPVDLARKRNHVELLEVLEPELHREVPREKIRPLQRQLHRVIASRVDKLVREHHLRLPQIEPLLEWEETEMWFAVPGMYGGFQTRFEGEGAGAELITSSWCRVAGGSGQRHRVTAEGWTLIEEGFV
jgi:hypothetical protein